jgi:hypothetical protein
MRVWFGLAAGVVFLAGCDGMASPASPCSKFTHNGFHAPPVISGWAAYTKPPPLNLTARGLCLKFGPPLSVRLTRPNHTVWTYSAVSFALTDSRVVSAQPRNRDKSEGR